MIPVRVLAMMVLPSGVRTTVAVAPVIVSVPLTVEGNVAFAAAGTISAVATMLITIASLRMIFSFEVPLGDIWVQCHLAYFGYAAVLMFSLLMVGLASLMVAGASWRVPCWPGFLTR